MEQHPLGGHHLGLGAVPALGNELEDFVHQDNEHSDVEAGMKISVNISEPHLAYGCNQVNLSQLDDVNVLQFNNFCWT